MKIIRILVIFCFCIEAAEADHLFLASASKGYGLRPMASAVSDSKGLPKEVFFIESLIPDKEKILWADILQDCLRKAGSLDNTDKIKDLNALLSIDKKYFKTNPELITVFRFYLNIVGRNHIRKPHKIPWHHAILKDLRLISDRLWDKYIKHIHKKPFPSDRQRKKWYARMKQGLKDKVMLDEKDKIKDLKALLGVTINFFNTTEVDGVKLRSIYVIYDNARRKGGFEKPHKVTMAIYIVKDLGFITDELWAEYEEHIAKEAKASYAEKLDEEREMWAPKIRKIFKEKDMLDEKGKIRDLKTLLSIKGDFFQAYKELRRIKTIYGRAVNTRQIEKEEKALLPHFIVRDLGFVSDELWAEYIRYRRKNPFPSVQQREKWQPILEKVLKDKDLLNEDGKIKDLTTLLGIEMELFEGLKEDKDKIQNFIYVSYARAIGDGRIDIPEESTIYHFILKDLGFITDELWAEYIMHGIEKRPRLGQYRKRKVPAAEKKKEWTAKLNKALKEQGRLNDDGMIESLDTLLSIGIEFFESDEELKAILILYPHLALRHRIRRPPGVFWHHTVLRGLGFVSDRLWEEYIECMKNTPFPSDEQREDWQAKLKAALGEERLDDDGRIKDIDTLMAITNKFFRSSKDLKAVLKAYAQAKKMGRIEKPKKVLWRYFILKDLGFLSDRLWQEYEGYGAGRITLSEEQKEQWRLMIEKRLKDKGKLNQDGQIEDLEALLSIIQTFFTSDDNLRNIPVYYSRADNIKKEEKAAWHHFVLRDLGFISDELWDIYIKFVKEKSLTLIEGKPGWQELLKVIFKDKGMLNDEGKIKGLDTLLGITSSFFERSTQAYGYKLRTIYRVYMQELKSGHMTKPKLASIQHYILRDLGFVSDKLWQEYLKSRKPSIKERKQEWKVSLSKALKDQGRLNEAGMIESLGTLLSIGVEFFESDEKLKAILASYPKLSSQYHISKPPLVSWHHLVLKDLGLVSEKLWQEYMSYLKKRPFPSEEQRGDWEPKVRQALGTKIVDEKGEIIDFKSLMSIGAEFFQSDKGLRPILKAYLKADKSGRIQKPSTVYMHHYILRDLGFISDELWEEYLKKKAFPSEKNRQQWRERLAEFLEDALLLDEQGKIIDLRRFMQIGREFFKQKRGRKGIWQIYLSYQKAVDKGLTEKPKLSSVYQFVLRDLGFVSDKMWLVYLKKRVFPPEDKKQQWQVNLNQALEDEEKLNPDGKIRDLDTLLSIGYDFYWHRTGEDGIRSLYIAYHGAIRDARIESPEGAEPCHVILKELGFVSDELWNEYAEYISRPKPFPGNEERREWEEMLGSVLRGLDKLDAEGKIKDLYALLSMEKGFFSPKTAIKGLRRIYILYSNAQNDKRIKVGKKVSLACFIFKDLGLVSDRLWAEYMKYLNTPQPFPSKFERQQWQEMLRPMLKEGGKLDRLGQIKDLNMLLSIEPGFFKSEDGKNPMSALLLYYKKAVKEGLVKRPKRVLSHYFILRNLGFISDELWVEYIKFLTAEKIIVTDEKRQAWIELLKAVLKDEKKLNEEGQIKDHDTLLEITYKYFKAKERGISFIYIAYSKAVNSAQIERKDESSLPHFILYHLGFISEELWAEHMEYLSGPKAVITDAGRKQWEKILRRILKLGEKEQIEDLDTLLGIKSGFFTSGKYKDVLLPIFSAYSKAIRGGYLEKPAFSTNAHFMLRDLGLVSDTLWAEYESYKAENIRAPGLGRTKFDAETAAKKFDALVSAWAKAYKKEDIAGTGFCIDGMNELLENNPDMPDWKDRRNKVKGFERWTTNLLHDVTKVLDAFKLKAGDDIGHLYRTLRMKKVKIARILSSIEKTAKARLRIYTEKPFLHRRAVHLYCELDEQINSLESTEREFENVEEGVKKYEAEYGEGAFNADAVGETAILRFEELRTIPQLKAALANIAGCLNEVVLGRNLRAKEILRQIEDIRAMAAQKGKKRVSGSVKQEGRAYAEILKSA